MTSLCRLALAIVGASPAAADEPIPTTFQSCFDGDSMPSAGPGRPLRDGQAQAVPRALAAIRGYRACFSHISLFQGGAWGRYEFAAPDRRRWRMRQRGVRETDKTRDLEVVQIGGDTWFREGGGAWSSLAAGRKREDLAAPGGWLPDPTELVNGFVERAGRLAVAGSGSARAGSCEVWLIRPDGSGPALDEAICVGSNDGLPYRVRAGGPAVEAYLQVELYDFAAPVEIRAPQPAKR